MAKWVEMSDAFSGKAGKNAVGLLLATGICLFTGKPAQGLDISVPIGGDIQSAVDQVSASGGGTVNLATGTYVLNSSLRIKSKVTLNGSGNQATVLQATGGFTAIQQASEQLDNVAIQNLSIIGKRVSWAQGIVISSGSSYHENVRISNVNVSECGAGVHVKRANNVTISNCNFSGNGTSVPADLKFAHNLYIRACNTVKVSDVVLNGSPSGNGLNISYCKDVTVVRCEAKNNFFRGMRAADTDGFTVQNCVLSGNGDVGLIANSEITATKNINFMACLALNNRGGGIQGVSGVTGSVTDCVASGNEVFQFNLPDAVKKSQNQTTVSLAARVLLKDAPNGKGNIYAPFRFQGPTGIFSATGRAIPPLLTNGANL